MGKKESLLSARPYWVCEGDHADIDGMTMAVPIGEKCPNCGADEPYESFRHRTDPPPWGQGRDE